MSVCKFIVSYEPSRLLLRTERDYVLFQIINNMSGFQSKWNCLGGYKPTKVNDSLGSCFNLIAPLQLV